MELSERERAAKAIRECLRYVLQDVSHANLPLVGMHVRIAILELDDFLERAGERDSGEKDAPFIPLDKRQASA